MKNLIKKIWIASIIFLLIPPGAVDTLRRRRRHGTRNSARRGYDSDFNEFMSNMFKNYPQKSRVRENKSGPNVGHRPYWYGYDYNLKMEDDYRLDNSDSALWRLPNKTLMGSNDMLGAGTLVDRDVPEDKTQNRSCFWNMGPTCELGQSPDELTEDQQVHLIKKTAACDLLCTEENFKRGLVCVTDSYGKLLQEMHFCVFEKMNCLGGIAVVQTTGEGPKKDWRRVPFALKQGWGRISIQGKYGSNIYFSDKYPAETEHNFWMVLSTYVLGGHSTAIWCDYRIPPPFWPPFPCYWGFRQALNGDWEWTEYTIVWNKFTGDFLMSQPRGNDYLNQWYWDRRMWNPWDIKYVDVSSNGGYKLRYILHDLPYDLTHVKDGRCRIDALAMPGDTQEVLDEVDAFEKAYQRRLKKAGIDPVKIAAEDPPYIEYQ